MLFLEDKHFIPKPIRQTNALDNTDTISRLTVASSTESVNSQEGA